MYTYIHWIFRNRVFTEYIKNMLMELNKTVAFSMNFRIFLRRSHSHCYISP